MYPDIHRYDRIAIYTETTGLRYKVDDVFGVSISLPDGRDFYWDIKEYDVLNWLRVELPRYRGTIIMHNAPFDVKMFDNSLVRVPLDRVEDTVIRASLIDEHLHSYHLDGLGKKYLGVGKVDTIYQDLADMFGGMATRNVQMPNLHMAPSSLTGPYAKQDTRLTLDLYDWQTQEINKQGIQSVVTFEKDKIPTFLRLNMRGIRVDLDTTERAMALITPEINNLQKRLDELAGYKVNVNSSPQIKALMKPTKIDNMWVAKDGAIIGTTDSGGPSLKAEFLRGMTCPEASLILDIRSMLKTRDTFLAKHILEHAVGGRVYPSVNQSKNEYGGTGTGRLSYTDPALQQIPSRNKGVAAMVKPCFLPEEGQVWLDADESSFEVRVFAHLVGNRRVIQAYEDDRNMDFHQFVADLTGLVRNATYGGQPNAKQLNLSMIFNSGNGAIADTMGMDWEWSSFTDKKGKTITYKKAGSEAIKVIDNYHRALPGVRELANRAKAVALSRGYIRTYTGRRLRFPRGHKAYKASGLLIQSTSAELNKENLVMIEEELGEDGTLLLNTHDSYSMSVEPDWAIPWGRVKKRLENRPNIKVPLVLELSGVGDNWWNAIS